MILRHSSLFQAWVTLLEELHDFPLRYPPFLAVGHSEAEHLRIFGDDPLALGLPRKRIDLQPATLETPVERSNKRRATEYRMPSRLWEQIPEARAEVQDKVVLGRQYNGARERCLPQGFERRDASPVKYARSST